MYSLNPRQVLTEPTASCQEQVGNTAKPQLLSRDEIEAEYGITRRWLELAALSGNGPVFIKIASRTVRYRRDELERWLSAREVRSTSEQVSDAGKIGGAK
jgi:hypothetical protein